MCLLLGAVTMCGVEWSLGTWSGGLSADLEGPRLGIALLNETAVFAWLWFCLILGLRDLWYTAIAAFHARRFRSRRHRGACQSCGYDLTGNTTGKCPECGAETVIVKR